MKGLINISCFKYLKQTFNIPNEFLIVIRALKNLYLKSISLAFLPPPENYFMKMTARDIQVQPIRKLE